MDNERFSLEVQTLRRPTGHSQEELAEVLGIRRQVLARKFLGKAAHFTHSEVKQIIKTLADWDGITTTAQAQELLALMDLPATVFSPAEWAAPPLAKLEKVVESPLRRSVPPPNSSPRTPAHNLPVPLTELIGREGLVRLAIERLRQPGVRLLTLVGPGGIGKTRLSLEIGHQLLAEYNHKVVFIDLANLTGAEQVPERLVQGLGLELSAGAEPTPALKEYLADQRYLIILDNFEQLLPAADLVSQLLQAAPDLKFLITSRAALQILGETRLGVPPLDLPDLDQLPSGGDFSALLQFEAMQLFVARAQAIQPNLHMNQATIEEMARLCVLLEGVPLSLELAAAAVKMLPLPYLYQRLRESKLETLSKGGRNLPARQQTLRATIEWSYGLLDEQARRLFNYLGIFRGSFNLEAVEQVCYGKNTPPDLLEKLEELIDQSLLKPQEGIGGEPRFMMLEMLREFAELKLQESGEFEELQVRYYHYYFQLLDKWTADFRVGPAEQLGLTTLLEQDFENFRAARDLANSPLELIENEAESHPAPKPTAQLQTHLTLTIRRPVEVVFAYFCKVETWPTWNSFVAEVQQLQPGPVRKGMPFRVVSLLRGRKVEQILQITEFVPGEYLVVQTVNGSMKLHNEFIFSEKAGQTSLTYNMTSNMSQLFRFTRPVLAGIIKRAQEVQFNRLKALLEAAS
jgi:predicted ATPase/transcriptional regulator with XRE-family HTH domain